MSPRTWQERIEDILDAIQEIQQFTGGLSFEQLQADSKTLKAVSLNFIVIGEASAAIPENATTAHPEIPWVVMKGMRNQLVHAYFSVDPQIVWDTIHNDLPPLVELLRKLLED